MKVVALGDAHLGRSYLPVTENSVNRREMDFEESFDRAVALALAQQPDLVLWLGDIFDQPKPSYRSFVRAQRALARIRDHGTGCIIISGNHDTPRQPGIGSPYTALAEVFDSFHFATRMTYERVELPGLTVHAVPQMANVAHTLDALAEADRSRNPDHTNLLLTHPRVPQVEPRYADVNEIEVDADALRADLVLLGHYHVHTQVGRGIWYAGSTDTFTFADDPDDAKGIVVLDTDTGECRHIALEGCRPLVTLPTIEALGLDHDEVQARVLAAAAAAPAGSVARVFVEGVDPEAWRLLDGALVREASAHALHFKPTPTFAGVHRNVAPAELELDAMPARWDRYLKDQDLTGYDRDRVRGLGHDYLARATDDAGG
jgi:DNA repair protein SbcD/Mre11